MLQLGGGRSIIVRVLCYEKNRVLPAKQRVLGGRVKEGGGSVTEGGGRVFQLEGGSSILAQVCQLRGK